MKIAIVGTGYVGLVSGACLARHGHQVTCVDIDAERVAAINEARTPFYEDGLQELLSETVPSRLCATSDLHAAVVDAEITMLTVGTPFNGTGVDLSQVEQAARQVGEALAECSEYQLVMVKSTVLPGTTDRVVLPILEQASGRRAGADFGVAMNPEFLREGQAVGDFLHPDRVVMGGIDERSWELQEQLYQSFSGCTDLLRTSNATAEMIKYTANSLLATMISFSNEIGNLCTTLEGVDVSEVLHGVHLDKRLMPILPSGERIEPGLITYLMAGCGFGGSCLPKDVRSLIAFGEQRGRPMKLLQSTLAVNLEQPDRLVELIDRNLAAQTDSATTDGSLAGRTIAVLGLAFKPGTSDLRDSPALPVVEKLQRRGAVLRLYDPAALPAAATLLGCDGLHYAEDLRDAVAGVDAVALLTSWPAFDALPAVLRQLDESPVVIDGRRMLDRSTVARYDGIGLGPAVSG